MATPTLTGLTHIVLLTPKRRADLTLPEHVPLAHLHATLLRHGGDDLVEDGVSHGGWVVRRLDGTPLDPVQSLAALGVRNGDVLLLSYRDQHWPEPSFDDLADGVADDAARLGAAWSGTATARAALATAGLALAGGVALALTAGPPFDRVGVACLVVSALLLASAAMLARLRGNPWLRGDDGPPSDHRLRSDHRPRGNDRLRSDHRPRGNDRLRSDHRPRSSDRPRGNDQLLGDDRMAGVTGAFALAYAAFGGSLVLGPATLSEALSAWHLLAGAAALLLASVLGLVLLGTKRRIFYSGATLGVAGLAGALIGTVSTPAGAVSAVAAGLVVLAPLLPRFAALQGGLPAPTVPSPAHGQTLPEPMPRPAELTAMVRRADELLSGVLFGACAALFACVATLAVVGDTTAVILAGLVVAILALRMRMFAAVRHRLPLGLASLGGLAALLGLGWAGLPVADRSLLLAPMLGALLLAAAAAIAVGATLSRRPPSPGLGRLADIVEVLCVIVTPVLACAVMGLFGLVRGLLNG